MKQIFDIAHIIACAAALIFGWQFLKSYGGHFENGIWDSSAITSASLIILMITAVILHLTYFVSQKMLSHIGKEKRKEKR